MKSGSKILFGIILLSLEFEILPESLPLLGLKNSAESMEDEIRKYIPVGTDIGIAQRIMEENKFSCIPVKKGVFLKYKNLAYVYCDLERRSGFIVSKRWQVALTEKNGKLEKVIAGFGLTGP